MGPDKSSVAEVMISVVTDEHGVAVEGVDDVEQAHWLGMGSHALLSGAGASSYCIVEATGELELGIGMAVAAISATQRRFVLAYDTSITRPAIRSGIPNIANTVRHRCAGLGGGRI